MKAFSVAGIERNIGKTSLVEALVKEFIARGYKVGTIKHIAHGHEFSIDTLGKDTFRHAQAGAKIIASVASSETAIIFKTEQEMKIDQVLDFFQNVNFVIVEGWSSARLQKIVIARNANEVEKMLSNGAALAITGPIAENSEERSKLKIEIPIFNNKTQISQLADLIENKLNLKEKTLKIVDLKVDSKQIPLAPFVQDFIRTTITGMISSLKKVEPNPKEIRLTIKK